MIKVFIVALTISIVLWFYVSISISVRIGDRVERIEQYIIQENAKKENNAMALLGVLND